MKKLFGYLLIIMLGFIVTNVYASDSYTLHRGESFLLATGRCTSDDSLARFYIDKANYQCLMTSVVKVPEPSCDENGVCMGSMYSIMISPLYGGGSVPMPGYYVSFDRDVEHEDGKVKLPELVALINDVDNETRKATITELESKIMSSKPEGATTVILEAGTNDNSIYINVGWDTEPVLLKIDYDEISNKLNYINETSDAFLSIVEPVVLGSFYEWTMEASPNYSTAKEIRDDETKSSYVGDEAYEDGSSGIEVEGSTDSNDYKFTFDIVLNDDKNDKVIESYNINVDKANEPEDPTEPVQPTEPVVSPNTGNYLSLIGILWLVMFAGVFIYCRKTIFKKI